MTNPNSASHVLMKCLSQKKKVKDIYLKVPNNPSLLLQHTCWSNLTMLFGDANRYYLNHSVFIHVHSKYWSYNW